MPENVAAYSPITALSETVYMVLLPLMIAVVAGGILGYLLFTLETPYSGGRRGLATILSYFLRCLFAFPFVVWLILIVELVASSGEGLITQGSVIGLLSVCGSAYFAVYCAKALKDGSRRMLDTTLALGLGEGPFMTDVLWPESKNGLFVALTNTAIYLLGASTIAGIFNIGGLGAALIGQWADSPVGDYGWLIYPAILLVLTFLLQWLRLFFLRRQEKGLQ